MQLLSLFVYFSFIILQKYQTFLNHIKLGFNTMILFGIVTYRERFWECKSFKSLYHSFKKDKEDDKIHIFIFDNTDIEDWDLTTPTFQDIKLEYTNDKEIRGSLVHTIQSLNMPERMTIIILHSWIRIRNCRIIFMKYIKTIH